MKRLEHLAYRALLRLYPRAFRERYGEEMTQVFRQQLEAQGSSIGFWVRVIWDAVTSAAQERSRTRVDTRTLGLWAGSAGAMIMAVICLAYTAAAINPEVESRLQPVFEHSLLLPLTTLPMVLVLWGAYSSLPGPTTRTERLGVVLLALHTGCFLLWCALLSSQSLHSTEQVAPLFLLSRWLEIGGRLSIGFGRIRTTRIQQLPFTSKLMIVWGLATFLSPIISALIAPVLVTGSDGPTSIRAIGLFLTYAIPWCLLGFHLLRRAHRSVPARAVAA